MITNILIFILAAGGFLVAKHIRNHKTKDTPLICPKKFDCHSVVHSDYSKFLGMPVELLGVIYYAFISIVFLVLILLPQAIPASLIILLLPITLFAFLFSLYLIGTQLFFIKKWCFWCLVSATISTLIFVLFFLNH